MIVSMVAAGNTHHDAAAPFGSSAVRVEVELPLSATAPPDSLPDTVTFTPSGIAVGMFGSRNPANRALIGVASVPVNVTVSVIAGDAADSHWMRVASAGRPFVSADESVTKDAPVPAMAQVIAGREYEISISKPPKYQCGQGFRRLFLDADNH